MKIIESNNWLQIYNQSNVIGNSITNFKNIEIVKLTINPNGEVGLHTLPYNVIFFVLKGSPTLLTQNKKITVQKNSTITVELNENRGWINLTNNICEILVIKNLEKK